MPHDNSITMHKGISLHNYGKFIKMQDSPLRTGKFFHFSQHFHKFLKIAFLKRGIVQRSGNWFADNEYDS